MWTLKADNERTMFKMRIISVCEILKHLLLRFRDWVAHSKLRQIYTLCFHIIFLKILFNQNNYFLFQTLYIGVYRQIAIKWEWVAEFLIHLSLKSEYTILGSWTSYCCRFVWLVTDWRRTHLSNRLPRDLSFMMRFFVARQTDGRKDGHTYNIIKYFYLYRYIQIARKTDIQTDIHTYKSIIYKLCYTPSIKVAILWVFVYKQ